jgi:UDP-N-acetylmuramyl pentapeptide phosphotransferase/UDP-N-acetylglucosamine-1-phosphate transferase
MSHALIAIALFVVTVAVSAFAVWKSIPLAHRLGLLDQPAPDRVHAKPKPRAGGPAMLIAFLIGVGLTFAFNVQRFTPEVERVALLVIGAAFVAFVLFYDDAIGIDPKPKLVLQIVAALIVVLPRFRGEHHGIVVERFNNPFGGEVELPLLIAVGFTIFWVVGMMNTLNWVDGLDGLAGTVTLVACVILFIHTYFWPKGDPQFTISLLPLILGAAVLGFLPFNWFPSKIIMGDSGAMFLGFTLGIISIIGGAKIATALLALGLPILDVAWLILSRSARRRSPGKRDLGHLHHRLLELGWSQPQVVLFVGGTSLVFGLLALLLPTRSLKLAAIAVLGLIILASVAAIARRTAPDNEKTSRAR